MRTVMQYGIPVAVFAICCLAANNRQTDNRIPFYVTAWWWEMISALLSSLLVCAVWYRVARRP